MAKKLNFNISSPLLYVILGALLVIFKMEMLNWAITLAGIFFTVIGIVDFIKGNTKTGILNAAIGIIILVVGWTILDIVLLVLGILIAAKGVMDLATVLKLKKRSVLRVVFAALTIALGVALAFGDLLGDLIAIVGVLLIIDGALGLLGAKK